MRDPEGRVHFVVNAVNRILYSDLLPDSPLYDHRLSEFISNDLLIDFDIASPRLIISPKLEFVSYPSEWSNLQLFDAAILTLNFSKLLYLLGYELKDANSWNVIFKGTSPIFCDLLSIQKIKSAQWVPFYQFFTNFIFPLYISKKRNIHSSTIYKISRLGISLSLFKKFLGLKYYFSIFFPLFFTFKSDDARDNTLKVDSHFKTSHHFGIYNFIYFILNRLKPIKASSFWSNYVTDRHCSIPLDSYI